MSLTAEPLFLVQAALLIGGPFLLWQTRFVQRLVPLVVLQIGLGLILGPSVLGHVAPAVFQTLFPPQSLGALNGLAWLGVGLFGFLSGLHLDLGSLTKRGWSFAASSASTLLVPLLLGGGLAWAFCHAPYVASHTNHLLFIIGVATAMAVTALPVLSAILLELKLIDHPLGSRVLGYAAINDIVLWLTLAGLSVYGAGRSAQGSSLLVTFGLTAVFLLVMLMVVRPLLRYVTAQQFLDSHPSPTQLAVMMAGILLAGLATDLIGLHFIFGAFLLGAVVPKEIGAGWRRVLEPFTMVALMPFYFMLTGLKTSFALTNSSAWLLFAIATVIAIVGKVLGTALAERFICHSSPSVALKAGILMQTKGLMELVVLNVLLSAGIINSVVFSSLVLMAVVVTALTKPALLLSERYAARTSMRYDSQKSATPALRA